MPVRSSPAKRKKAVAGILLRYRETDTTFGVTRATATRLAKTLGLSETQVIHVALAHFARQNLPAYEADDGPLTDDQMSAIERLQPPGRMKVKSRLF
ncbi:MAG: hypothetical protein HYY28_03390 [Betaproteobacteria bacterium]|nr:hypothetical protein [Betaproteobacteria bacterium]MBI2959332.1 hypothetical protein [Betaproteobacteria bacterium]